MIHVTSPSVMASFDGTAHEIGVLFDIDVLGPGYRHEALTLLLGGLEPARLAGCALSAGEPDVTTVGFAPLYCIAVRTRDPGVVDHVRAAVEAGTHPALPAPMLRIVDGRATAAEPLSVRRAVDVLGRLVIAADDVLVAGSARAAGAIAGWRIVVGDPGRVLGEWAWPSRRRPDRRTSSLDAPALIGGDRWAGIDVGTVLLRRLAECGDADQAPRAMLALAVLLDGRDDRRAAEQWCRRGARSGHGDVAPMAMFMLGSLLAQRGDTSGARRWYLRAVESGHPDEAPKARANLANLLYREGDLVGAAWHFERAVTSGHTRSASVANHNLALLLAELSEVTHPPEPAAHAHDQEAPR